MQHCNANVCCLPYHQWGWYCTCPRYHWQVAALSNYLYYIGCHQPVAPYASKTTQKLPGEVLADSVNTHRQVLIGGTEPVSLSLEYLKDPGATSPQVTVSVTENGNTATWSISGIPDEYQVKTGFGSASPGAVVALDVAGCTARLRWCETVCC